MRIIPEDTGSKFGKWTQAGASFTLRGQRLAVMHCQCGTRSVVPYSRLRSGTSNSCRSCLKTHGQSNSPTFRVWDGMRDRCNNPNHVAYSRYGGRGISICPEWDVSGGGFERFLADMGERPSLEYQIDRINNDGNYEPGNCRWATRTEQARNKAKSHRIVVGGVEKSPAEWAQLYGMSVHTIRTRLRLGWTGERAVTTPARKLKGVNC